jgi:hypothetical protein
MNISRKKPRIGMMLPPHLQNCTMPGIAARINMCWELPLLALLAFCYFLYFTHHLPFYWHDYDYLIALERGIDWKAVFSIGRGFFYRPLETVVFSGLYAFFGSNPLGYRLFKALIVAFLIIALYILVRLLSGSRMAAAISSLVLIISPSTLQSAMYFSDFELLAETLVILSLILLAFYCRSGSKRWLAGIFLFVMAACLIKETARIYPLLAMAFFIAFEGRSSLRRRSRLLLLLVPISVWPNLFGAGGLELFKIASLDRAARFAFRMLTGITLPLAVVIMAALLPAWNKVRRYLPGCNEYDKRIVATLRFMVIWLVLVLPLTALAPLSEWRYQAVLSLPLAGIAGMAITGLVGYVNTFGNVRKASCILLILLLGFTFRQSFSASRSTVAVIGSYVSGLDMIMRFIDSEAVKGHAVYYQSWRSELYSRKGVSNYVNISSGEEPLRYLLQSRARRGDFFLLLPLQQLPAGLPASYVKEFVSGTNRFVLYSIN